MSKLKLAVSESNYLTLEENMFQFGAYFTDMAIIDTSVTLQGKVKSIHHYLGESIWPKELDVFEKAVQAAITPNIDAMYFTAANQGNSKIQQALAENYYNSHPSNYNEAYFWAILASRGDDNGKSYASKIRDKTEKLLTPEQIAEIKKRVDEWKPTPSTQEEKK